MSRLRVCPDCLSSYKRSREGRQQRKLGLAWGRGKWPDRIYHRGKTRTCEKHRAIALHESASRRCSQLSATPSFSDKEKIKEIYRESVRKTLETGVKHHVDHIVPLRGKNVCGLHVDWNLQVLTAQENIRKSNSFI